MSRREIDRLGVIRRVLEGLWGDYEVASVSKAKFSGSGWELEPAERESDR